MSRWFRVVLAMSVCVTLVGCGAGSTTPTVGATVPPAATAPPAASASAAASPTRPAQSAVVVTSMADMSAFVSGHVGDAIAMSAGFLVVGYAGRADNGVDGAVWTSADGLAWTKGPNQPSFVSRVLTDVVAHRGGFAAGGAQCPETGGGECAGLNLWTSSDGQAWLPSTFEVPGDADCCDLEALTEGGPGLVGVASDLSDVSSGPKDALSITSTAGTTWVAHRKDPVFVDATTGSVTAGGPGLVAVGNRADGSFAAWNSSNGSRWTSAAPPTGVPTGEARDVIAAGPGFVAIGKDGPDAAVWTSADGVAWARVPTSDALKGGAMDRMTKAGSGLVAVGKAGLGAAVWTSTDGIAWTRLADQASFEGAEMTSVAGSGKTLVIFGKRPTGPMPAWTGALP